MTDIRTGGNGLPILYFGIPFDDFIGEAYRIIEDGEPEPFEYFGLTNQNMVGILNRQIAFRKENLRVVFVLTDSEILNPKDQTVPLGFDAALDAFSTILVNTVLKNSNEIFETNSNNVQLINATTVAFAIMHMSDKLLKK
jgi:hypothetical protein